jgi:site-specific DNA recombinase
MQVQLILPQLVGARATLWCPQVGGPVDPNSEAHDIVLNLSGGLSKTERRSRRRSVLRKNSRRPPVDSKAAGPLTGTGASVHRSAHPNSEKARWGTELQRPEVEVEGTVPILVTS